MALRRVLPSRLTGAPPPDGTAVPTPHPPAVTPAAPQATPVADAQPSASSQLAAAAGNAFGTLPQAAAPQEEISSAPARVLEDSFIPVAVTAPATPEVMVEVPTPQVMAPADDAFAIPPAPKAEVQPQQAAPQAAEPAEIQPAPQGPTDFLADANLQASRPDANSAKRRVQRGGGLNAALAAAATPKNPPVTHPAPPEKPAPVQTAQVEIKPEPQSVFEAKPEAQPQPEPQPASAAVAAPVEAAPSQPRTKRPRNFAAATIQAPNVEEAARPVAQSESRIAPDVPVDTRPLSKVDEELIASGIIAGPEADSLTSGLPASMAAAEEPLPDDFLFPAASSNTPPAAPSFTLATAPYNTPKTQPEEAPLPTANSGLPWANTQSTASDWDVDMPAPQEGAQPAAPQPPADIYKNVSTPAAATTPSWATPGSTIPQPHSNSPAPELPGQRPYRTPPTSKSGVINWGYMVGMAAVIGLGLFAWSKFNQSGEMIERMGRWTNSLQNNTEVLPPVDTTLQAAQPANQLQPESTFSMANITPSATAAILPPPATPDAAAINTQIDFAPSTNQPIAADAEQPMPDDISVFAKFQKAVSDARAKQKGQSPTEVVAEATKPESKLTTQQLQDELAAYRRTLNEQGPAAPKPTEFMKDPAAYMDGKSNIKMDSEGAPIAGNTGTLLPPPVEGSAAAKPGLLPPPDLYTNNPKNLPVTGEPIAGAPARVRNLQDFADAVFEPDTPKVRIPKGIKPKFAASDFPALEVLSFVPGRGVIAYTDGREGALMIGEAINGWELTNVTSEVAEFKAGQKTHYITPND